MLICNAARGFASRLAGGLALATTAVINSLCNVLGFNSLNSLHYFILRLHISKSIYYVNIISHAKIIVNRFAFYFLLFSFERLTKHASFDIIGSMMNSKSKEILTMKKTEIVLAGIQDVRDFVNIVVMIDYEVDLAQGRYLIDAKSIMGIFSLDLLSPITVIAHTDYADDFFEKIARFAVK